MTPSLYIHVPFCSTKCGYCDFYSIPRGKRSTASLVGALLAEISQRREELGARPQTVFIGGGTPTVLPDDDLSRLAEAITKLAAPDESAEFSVEANPATLTSANAAILRSAGVNRLSIGAQSFHKPELALLERIHDPDDIAIAVQIARAAGIRQLNLDLIFGIPGQTMQTWMVTLDQALSLEPDHLACYGLTYEPNTPLTARLHDGRILACDEQLEADMMLACRDRLRASGFEHYEISNYARPGRRCQHNMQYWRNLPYVGVGPSAAGYVNGCRYKNVPDVSRYIRMIKQSGTAVIEEETLSPLRRAGETAMLRLRLLDGICIEEFRVQTGFDPFQLFQAPIESYLTAACLKVDETSIRLTPKGLLLGDMVMADFLDAAVKADGGHKLVDPLPRTPPLTRARTGS